MKALFRLALTFGLLASGHASAGALLGPAAGYDGFFFGDFTLTNSSAGGSVAAGGNADLSGFSVGAAGAGTAGSLVVGGNLTAANGSIGGNAVYGGTDSVSGIGLGGTLGKGTPVDFAVAQTYYDSYSTALSQVAANGSSTFQYGGLTLTGSSAALNVFDISGAQLAGVNSFAVNVPNGSTVLINVSGTSDSLSNFGFSESTSQQDVLFNFYQATAIDASSIAIAGSVLAPWADFTFGNGDIQGELIAEEFSGGQYSTGSLQNDPFQGNLPSLPVVSQDSGVPVPEPSSIAMFGFCLLAFVAVIRRRRPYAGTASTAALGANFRL